jgi:UPF0176 protein
MAEPSHPSHIIIAYYHLTAISDPALEVAIHKEFFRTRDITSRIYVAKEGINCQMSATWEHGHEYMAWMRSREHFEEILFKVDPYHEHVFPRTTVKTRNQLVAFDFDVDLKKCGHHLSPCEWKAKLDKAEPRVVLDIRNDYEWQIGRFEDAECPPCNTSRDFKEYAETLREKVDPQKTPVMMYCTGGIRCEYFSALLKEQGFAEVYQLHGGVIGYSQQQGNDHWVGKLFVFDDRLTAAVGTTETATVGSCRHCALPCDVYYNCANMDCNELFICCPACVEKLHGCCQESCITAARVRPYQITHKPFKRLEHKAKRPSV